MPIERVKQPDLQTRIIAEIKTHIYTRQLAPGDMLPSQAALCELTGASRTTVREAIKTMEAQGLLRVVNGAGIYVENIDTSFYVGEMNRGYILRRLIDALRVRKALECMAVEQCTILATDEQLQALSSILSQVEERYRRGEDQAELDLLFHQKVIALSGNALLIHMLKNLMQASSGIWSIRIEDLAAILSASIPQHRVMMDRMIARDPKGAAEAHNEYMSRELQLLSELAN